MIFDQGKLKIDDQDVLLFEERAVKHRIRAEAPHAEVPVFLLHPHHPGQQLNIVRTSKHIEHSPRT